MNGTKTTFSEFECGGMPDMTSEVQEGVLVLSIVLDLIAGCFSAGFLFKMYQGIEIGHPIYAIVFSNISFSTGVSMTSFVLTLVDMYVSSCTPAFLQLSLNTSTILVNVISWIGIACLRFYLLIAQTNKKHEVICSEIDMQKLRKIALVSYWSTIFTLFTVRYSIIALNYFELISLKIRGTLNSIILIVILITTFGIYYKLDYEFKKKQENVITKEKCKLDAEEKIEAILSEQSYGRHQTDPPNVKSAWVQMPLNIRSLEDDHSYGGIYVGDHMKGRNSIIANQQTLDLPSCSSYIAKIPETSDGEELIIHKRNANYDKTNIGMDNEMAQDFNNKLTKTKIIPWKPGAVPPPSPSIGGCKEDGDMVTTLQVHVATPKSFAKPKTRPSHKRDVDHVNSKLENECMKNQNITVENIEDIDLEKISVFQDNCKSLTLNSSFHEDKESDCGKETNEDYKNSKEHKSILRAILINLICTGLVLFLIILPYFLPMRDGKGLLYLVINSLILVYRTFFSLLSAIYCFDVIHRLFVEILRTTIENLHILYNRIRRCVD